MGKAANSSISLKQIHVTDNFWNKYVHLVKDVIIPYQWDILNDKLEDVETSHCIENFKKASRAVEARKNGEALPVYPTDKWHYAIIEINSNTFGYDAENEICEQDYEDFIIGDLLFHSTAWAYPHATINEIGGGIDCAESNCGIYLTDYNQFENYPSLVDACTEQSCKMFKEPLEYQNWLLKMLLEEQTIFIEKHYPMLQSLGFRMLTTDLYKRGFQGEYTSEIWFEFVSKSGQGHLFIHQDLFDGRLIITT